MAHEISTGKSICILGTVVACFAVLWPNIFYPMLKGSVSLSSEGCCDVLLDKDVNGVKLVNELCSTVLKLSNKYDSNFYFSTNRLNKDAVKECRNVVLETCDIDINALLKDTIELDTKYKHVLDDIRTFNKSLCLKYHFDITLDLLGTPHRVKKYNLTTATNYYRQERKSRAKVEGLHPAFRQASPPRRLDEDPSIIYHDEEDTPPPPITTIHHEAVAGKKPPVPGMRPTVGGNGYVAQHKGSGTMGILMPMYTIGIVAFFTYTILRLLSKKPDNQNNFMHDPEFCRNVFSNNDSQEKSSATANADPASKLGDIEIDHLRRRLAETEATMDRIVKQMNLVSMTLAKPLNESIISAESAETKVDKAAEELNGKDIDHDEDSNEMEKVNGIVKVIGMELNESCENGKPWKRSPSPPAVKTPPPQITPQEIILPGNVPINSQILVSDAHTENISNESNVILESKVTLNVISPDLNNESESENENENLEINGLKSAHNDDVVEKETNQMNGHNSANDFEVSDSASENRNGGRNESDDESEDEQENTEL